MLNLFKEALKVNFFDNELGLDGATWCLVISGMAIEDGKFCFWSPDYEPKRRGLEGLVNLEKYLTKFAELKIAK